MIQPKGHKIQLDSSSSSEDDKSDNEDFQEIHPHVPSTADNSNADLDDIEHLGATMWLGTEDGYIHVYSSTDNIRIKKNKMKMQHPASILSLM